jgi:O-antigen biosynthesis protein WbqV
MLDMGDPVRILDLANALIRSRGLRPGKDIEVVFTGARHGERLTENLLGPGEGWRPTQLLSVNEVVTPIASNTVENLNWTIERLDSLAKDRKTTELTRVLKQAVWAPSQLAIPEEPADDLASEAAQSKHDIT